MSSQLSERLADRLPRRKTLALAACLAVTLQDGAWAADRALWVQGVFCNTEDQIDDVLAYLGEGRSPRTAADLANGGDAVCTFVDLLHYAVDDPMIVGQGGATLPTTKYRARLVGVAVGDEIRAVSPPVEIYFVTPTPLVEAAVERRA